jgi:hypothetical protein
VAQPNEPNKFLRWPSIAYVVMGVLIALVARQIINRTVAETTTVPPASSSPEPRSF